MTSAPSESHRKRIERLEATSSKHSRLLSEVGNRPDSGKDGRDVRLAITVDHQSYPPRSGSGVPVFPIKFIDATFTQSPGVQPLSTQERGTPGAEYDQLAASINGNWIEPGTVVKVLWQRPPAGLATEDGGEWFIEPYSATPLTLLSPVDCFESWETTPQAMYLHELNGCEWSKTQTTVYAVDPNDTNFLLPGETQFAQIRTDCEYNGKPVYDLVGSRGLRRRAKVNDDIECDTLGKATIHELSSGASSAACGVTAWVYTSTALQSAINEYWYNGAFVSSVPAGSWYSTEGAIQCTGGCKPIPPSTSGVHGEGRQTDCEGHVTAGPAGCDATETTCEIDVCNNWLDRTCLPKDRPIEVQYMKRGIWTPIINVNRVYFANITEPICPDNLGSVGITNVEAIEFCEPEEITQAITSAINKFGHAGSAGDPVMLWKVTTDCEDKVYITDILKVCRDVPMTDDCGGDGVYLDRENCEWLRSKVQKKVAIETCTEEPETINQIALKSAAVSRYTLTASECVITLNRFDRDVCVFAEGTETSGQPTSVTFTKERFLKVDITVDPDSQGSGSGLNCGEPKLTITTAYALQLTDCTSDGDDVEVGLIEVPYVESVDWGDANTCPSDTQQTMAVLGVICGPEAGVTTTADCDDYECPDGSGAGIKSLTNSDSPYTVASTDTDLYVDASSGAVTINLPAVASSAGREIDITKTDSSANAVTLDPNGSETINGATTLEITGQYDSVRAEATSTEWFVK